MACDDGDVVSCAQFFAYEPAVNDVHAKVKKKVWKVKGTKWFSNKDDEKNLESQGKQKVLSKQ